jgi:hypothetical protein
VVNSFKAKPQATVGVRLEKPAAMMRDVFQGGVAYTNSPVADPSMCREIEFFAPHGVVGAYISHHNEHRPHRSLDQRPPLSKPPPAEQPPSQIGRRDRLGGLIHEYYAIAA